MFSLIIHCSIWWRWLRCLISFFQFTVIWQSRWLFGFISLFLCIFLFSFPENFFFLLFSIFNLLMLHFISLLGTFLIMMLYFLRFSSLFISFFLSFGLSFRFQDFIGTWWCSNLCLFCVWIFNWCLSVLLPMLICFFLQEIHNICTFIFNLLTEFHNMFFFNFINFIFLLFLC